MKFNKLRDKKWFPMAVALCIAVLFWFLLTHLPEIGAILGKIWYFIYPVAAGGILAYLLNPLVRFNETKLLKGIKHEKLRSMLSMILAVVFAVVFILFLIGMIIPQLYDSIVTLIANRDMYFNSLMEWLEGLGNATIYGFAENLLNSSQDLLGSIRNLISENSAAIQQALSDAGGHITAWLIGLVFSVYFLADKKRIGSGASMLLRKMHKSDETFENTMGHIKRIDFILTRYVSCSLLEAVIVGAATAIFMAIMRMPYIGLEAVIIGAFNLIPTFGPMIGVAIGTIILLLVNPLQALYFMIFVMIIQAIDGYLLKPKLFGETFGISGLWILIAVIVGGRIFGVIGIILAIPVVAILDYLIKNVWMVRRKKKEEEIEEKEETQEKNT